MLNEQLNALKAEKEAVAVELAAAKDTVQTLEHKLEEDAAAALESVKSLEQKLAAAEQSGEMFARQLVKVNDSYHTKLVARDEELARERAEMAKEKEVELQQQHTLFLKETELWKHEIGMLTKTKLELDARVTYLETAVDDVTSLKAEADAEHRTELQAQQALVQEQSSIARQWKDRVMMLENEVDALRAQMTSSEQRWCNKHDALFQQLQMAMMAREDQIAKLEVKTVPTGAVHEPEQVPLARMSVVVHGVQGKLRQAVTATRNAIQQELTHTQRLLERLRLEANELAIHQNGKDMALMARQSRIIQLESQSKNDRQTIQQLESTVTAMTRSREKSESSYKTKYLEQKEHLDITLAVRHGLAGEVQSKRQQIAELETRLRAVTVGKDKSDSRAKQLQQQVAAMKLAHARELEKWAVTVATTTTRSQPIVSRKTPITRPQTVVPTAPEKNVRPSD